MNLLFICTLLIAVVHCKPGGYFRQEYQFKKSSSTYQNNQLQTKDDDEGFYHKQGDLEGPAKVEQHNEQSQYVSPELGGLGQTMTAYDNRDLTSEAERAFNSHGLGVQDLQKSGGGARSYSSYSSYSTYGSTSAGRANLQALKQNLQQDLDACLRDAITKYKSEGGHRSQTYMENQLKSNVTRLMQEALYRANPSAIYTVTASGVYNNQNMVNQELTDLRSELERRLVGELQQEIRNSVYRNRGTTRRYYDSAEIDDLNRNSRRSDVQYLQGGGNSHYVQGQAFSQSQSSQVTERTSYAAALSNTNSGVKSKPSYNYQPIHVEMNSNVRLNDVMQTVQNTIHRDISEALREHQRKYGDATSYRLTNSRPSYEASLRDLKQQVQYNLTDLIQRELDRNYGVQTKLQGYSFSLNAGNTANYKLEDFDDLKRTVEANLNTFLENSLRTQETSYQQQVSTMNARNRDYNANGPQFTKSLTQSASYASQQPQYAHDYSSSNYQTRSSVDNAELEDITRRLQGELSRQLQKAVEEHRRTQSYTANSQELYRELESELKRNITEELQRSLQTNYGNQGRKGGFSYTVTSGVYNPSANYKTQDLDAMMRQMQLDLEKQLREQVNSGSYKVISSGPYVLHSTNSAYSAQPVKKYQQFSSYSHSSSGGFNGEDCDEQKLDQQHRYKREAKPYGYYGRNAYNNQQQQSGFYGGHNHQDLSYERDYHQIGQQLEDLDHLGQQLEELGQQPEQLGQELEDIDFDNLGQTADDDDYYVLTPQKQSNVETNVPKYTHFDRNYPASSYETATIRKPLPSMNHFAKPTYTNQQNTPVAQTSGGSRRFVQPANEIPAEEVGQQLESLGQETVDLDHIEPMHSQSQITEEEGQQLENLGQETVDLDHIEPMHSQSNIPTEEVGQRSENLGQETVDLDNIEPMHPQNTHNFQFDNTQRTINDNKNTHHDQLGQELEELDQLDQELETSHPSYDKKRLEQLGQEIDDALEQLGQVLTNMDGLPQHDGLEKGQVQENDWGYLNQHNQHNSNRQSGFEQLDVQSQGINKNNAGRTYETFDKGTQPFTRPTYTQHNAHNVPVSNVYKPANPNQNYDDVINIEDLISSVGKSTTYKPYRGIGLPRPTTTPKPSTYNRGDSDDFQNIEEVFAHPGPYASPKKPRFEMNPPAFTPELEPEHVSAYTPKAIAPYKPYSDDDDGNTHTPMIYRHFNREHAPSSRPVNGGSPVFYGQNAIPERPIYVSHNALYQPNENSQQIARDYYGNVRAVNDFRDHGDYLEYIGDRKDITHMETNHNSHPVTPRNHRTYQESTSPKYTYMGGHFPQSPLTSGRNDDLHNDMSQQSENLGQELEDLSQVNEDLDHPSQRSDDFHDLTQQSEDFAHQFEGLTQQSEDLTHHSQQQEDLTQQQEDLTQHPRAFNHQTADLTQYSNAFNQHSDDLMQHSRDLTQQSEDLSQQPEDLQLFGSSEDLTQHTEFEDIHPKTHSAPINNPPSSHYPSYGRSLDNAPKQNPLAEDINEIQSATETVAEPPAAKSFWKSIGGKISTSFSTVKQKAKDLMG